MGPAAEAFKFVGRLIIKIVIEFGITCSIVGARVLRLTT
jgi:hypothetical protein